MFRSKTLIFQSKANLDKELLFSKIAHYLDPELSKMLVVGDMFRNERSTFHSGL